MTKRRIARVALAVGIRAGAAYSVMVMMTSATAGAVGAGVLLLGLAYLAKQGWLP